MLMGMITQVVFVEERKWKTTESQSKKHSLAFSANQDSSAQKIQNL